MELDWRPLEHAPSEGIDLDYVPPLIGQVDVDSAVRFGDTHMHRQLWTVKPACLGECERLRPPPGLRLPFRKAIVRATKERLEALRAHRPGLTVAAELHRRPGAPVGRVEQLDRLRDDGEGLSRCHARPSDGPLGSSDRLPTEERLRGCLSVS